MPRVFSDECFFPFRVRYPIWISFFVAIASEILYRYYFNARARLLRTIIITQNTLAYSTGCLSHVSQKRNYINSSEIRNRDRGTFMIFFCGLGRRYRVSRTGRFACLDEAVSVVTSVSEHARALELNPRNIHTEAPSRYYRGIIQTYLYPSPMTADMTCDRLRYRLHDMPRSLSPSITISFPHSLQPFPTFLTPPPSTLENASLERGVISLCGHDLLEMPTPRWLVLQRDSL